MIIEVSLRRQTTLSELCPFPRNCSAPPREKGGSFHGGNGKGSQEKRKRGMGKFSPPPPPPVDKMGCWEFSYCFRRKVEGSITKMVEKKRKEAYILLQCREIERMKEKRSLHKNVKGSPTGVQRASLLRCLCLLLLMPWLIQRRVISEVSEGNSFFFFNFLFYIGI